MKNCNELRLKKCGCKEKCFKKGEMWGHLEGVMCECLSEKCIQNTPKSFCLKYNEFVETY